jgi:hypothetical protein
VSGCPRTRDSLPVGWGDHVRWQHGGAFANPSLAARPDVRTVGERAAEAIRGARIMRGLAYSMVEQQERGYPAAAIVFDPEKLWDTDRAAWYRWAAQ